jgi:hypothetical protein
MRAPAKVLWPSSSTYGRHMSPIGQAVAVAVVVAVAVAVVVRQDGCSRRALFLAGAQQGPRHRRRCRHA